MAEDIPGRARRDESHPFIGASGRPLVACARMTSSAPLEVTARAIGLSAPEVEGREQRGRRLGR